jgi:hypothetical protein
MFVSLMMCGEFRISQESDSFLNAQPPFRSYCLHARKENAKFDSVSS